MKRHLQILAALMIMVAPLKAQSPESVFALTPALPSSYDLLQDFKVKQDDKSVTTNPVDKFRDAYEQNERKVKDLNNDSANKNRLLEQAMNSKTSLGISAGQVAGMSESDLKSMAGASMMGNLSSMGLSASDLAKMQSGNLSEEDQQALINKVMKAKGGITSDDIQKMQSMSEEQRAEYMQSQDPAGLAKQRMEKSQNMAKANKSKGAAIMGLQSYDAKILAGMNKSLEMEDATRAKGIELFKKKYSAQVHACIEGMREAIRDGALEEIPEDPARSAAASKRLEQFSAQKYKYICDFYEEYLPIWRGTIVSIMDNLKNDVLKVSEEREAMRQRLYAQTQSADFVAPAFTPMMVASDYFDKAGDILEYELDLPIEDL